MGMKKVGAEGGMQLNITRMALRSIFLGVAAAVLVNVVILLMDMRKPSMIDPFAKLQLGMTRSQATAALQTYGVDCSDAVSGDPALCGFSDRWRTYTITFDQHNTLVAKRFYFTRPLNGLDYFR